MKSHMFKKMFVSRRSGLVIRVLTSIFLIMLFIPSIAQADLRKEASDVLVDLARDFQNNHNTVEAVHEYSKALLADPNNQEAKDGLAELGFSQGLYKPLRTNATKAVAVNEQLNVYSQRMGQLKQARVVMDRVPQRVQIKKTSLLTENSKESKQVVALNEKMKHLDFAANDFNAPADFGKMEINELKDMELSSVTHDRDSSMDMSFSKSSELTIEEPKVAKPVQRVEHKGLTGLVVSSKMKANQKALSKEKVKVLVEDLENKLSQVNIDSVDHEIALVKMQNDMIKYLDGSIQAHQDLGKTQEKLINRLDENINQPQHIIQTQEDRQLKAQLFEAQDRVSEQNILLKKKEKQVLDIETDLSEANGQVDRILR